MACFGNYILIVWRIPYLVREAVSRILHIFCILKSAVESACQVSWSHCL